MNLTRKEVEQWLACPASTPEKVKEALEDWLEMDRELRAVEADRKDDPVTIAEMRASHSSQKVSEDGPGLPRYGRGGR